jgi:hypothetical protein
MQQAGIDEIRPIVSLSRQVVRDGSLQSHLTSRRMHRLSDSPPYASRGISAIAARSSLSLSVPTASAKQKSWQRVDLRQRAIPALAATVNRAGVVACRSQDRLTQYRLAPQRLVLARTPVQTYPQGEKYSREHQESERASRISLSWRRAIAARNCAFVVDTMPRWWRVATPPHSRRGERRHPLATQPIVPAAGKQRMEAAQLTGPANRDGQTVAA